MNFAPRQRQTPSVATASPSRGRADSSPDQTPRMVRHFLDSTATALDSNTRAFFEPRFGHDFSGVRVHSDAEAAASARALHANAYTVGQHIAFDAGKYRPGTRDGQKLIAHELAHTVQQREAVGGSGPLSLVEPTDRSETEADRASDAIHDGRVSIGSRRPLSVQRQANPAAPSGVAATSGVDMPRLDADLAESASPFMAAAIGSVTVDRFETGKDEISPTNLGSLSKTAETMLKLMKQYPGSTVRLIGHTDAVGQESDNQALGQARADAVQEALAGKGIPAQSMHAESRGASELLVKTKMAEPRNRRVDVRFSPGQRFQSIMSQGLSPSPAPNPVPQPAPAVDLFKLGPNAANDVCAPPRQCPAGPGGPQSAPPAALQPLPSDIPYELMDVQSLNAPFTAHGNKPEVGGDLRATWGRLYLKYRYGWGLTKERAAQMANSELGGTAGASQTHDSPNAMDRANQDFKNLNPDAKGVGPFNLPWKWRF
jgi:outer membrane protein OmpA-like peptidoglycan-associated protein